jgi:hypothetical protein
LLGLNPGVVLVLPPDWRYESEIEDYRKGAKEVRVLIRSEIEEGTSVLFVAKYFT